LLPAGTGLAMRNAPVAKVEEEAVGDEALDQGASDEVA